MLSRVVRLLVLASLASATARAAEFDVPPKGCGSQKKASSCNNYFHCRWSKKKCVFEQFPPTKAPTQTQIPTPQPTLGPTEAGWSFPGSGCKSKKSKVACKKYTGCRWRGNSCRDKPATASPTKPPATPTMFPTSFPNEAPTTAFPTNSPVTFGDVPKRGCRSQKKASSCGEYQGCAWHPKKGCISLQAPSPAPKSAREFSIKCDEPDDGCGSLNARGPALCEAHKGCFYNPKSKKCLQKEKCSFSCGIKALAFEFAELILPRCAGALPANAGVSTCKEERRAVFDALNLKPLRRGVCELSFDPRNPEVESNPGEDEDPFVLDLHVDPVRGDDEDSVGTFRKPFRTIQAALEASRVVDPDVSSRAILLSEGTHFISDTIKLSANDALLTIKAKNHAKAVISGGLELPRWLTSEWQRHVVPGVWKLSLPEEIVGRLGERSELYVDGVAAIRARHPNVADPFRQGLYSPRGIPTGYNRRASWKQSQKLFGEEIVEENVRPENNRQYSRFAVGKNGAASVFDPPFSYYAVEKPEAGGGCVFTLPTGLSYFKTDVPEFASMAGQVKSKPFVHAFHTDWWGNWIFRVLKWDIALNSMDFDSNSGFHEARGDCRQGGREWFVENSLSLLDEYNEFFLDLDTANLYWKPNSDFVNLGAMSKKSFVLTQPSTTELISIKNGARRINIKHLRLSHSYDSSMHSHEVPSGGDWTITRHASVLVENARDVLIEGNHFFQLGGNGVLISKRNDRIDVRRNRFERLGASAVLIVGDPSFESSKPWDFSEDPPVPTRTRVDSNVMFDFGGIVKQSGGVFQALSKSSDIAKNTIFNGPRVGINFNDGFGGDDVVEDNLLFELVRETLDHGPINAWDRQPYLQKHSDSDVVVADPMLRRISENFMIGTRGGNKGVDFDDGASMYLSTKNLIVYGYQKLKGRDVSGTFNLILFPFDYGLFLSTLSRVPGNFEFTDNVIVSNKDLMYGHGSDEGTCQVRNLLTTRNVFFVKKWETRCFEADENFNFGQWKSKGHDGGSILSQGLPTTAEILELAAAHVGL